MATSLNSGFNNNINILEIRSSATSLQRVTDRSLSGVVTLATDPPGPSGIKRSVVEFQVDTDGGVEHRTFISTPYTIGNN